MSSQTEVEKKLLEAINPHNVRWEARDQAVGVAGIILVATTAVLVLLYITGSWIFYEAPREEFADRSGDLAGVVHDLGIELLDFEHDLSLAITENRDNASDNYWTVSLRNEYRALSGEVFDHQSSLAALRSQALKARIAMDSDNRNYGQAQMGDALERAPDLLEPLPELFDRIESLFDRSRGLGPNFRLRERLARARVLVNEVTESIG